MKMPNILADTFSVIFTKQELGYVLDILGGQHRAGTRTQTYSKSVGMKEHRTVLESLRSQCFLEERNGTIVLDETIAALAGILIFAERKISVTQIGTGAVVTRQLSLFASHGLVVEQTNLMGGQIELTAVRACEVLLPRVLSFLQISDRKVIDNQSCRLSQKDWTQLPYLLADGELEDGINFLLHRGVEKNVATRLAKAIAHPQRQSVLQLFESRQSEQGLLANLTVIEDVYGYWIAQPVNKSGRVFIETRTVGAVAVRKAVTQTICRLFEGFQ
jgi:hypothetical protein